MEKQDRRRKAERRIRKKYAAFDRAAKNVRGMRMYGGSYKGRSIRFTSDSNKARVFKDSKTENLTSAVKELQRENDALKKELEETKAFLKQTKAGFPIFDEESSKKRALPVFLTPSSSPQQDSPESKSRSDSDPFETPGRLFNLSDSPYNLYK